VASFAGNAHQSFQLQIFIDRRDLTNSVVFYDHPHHALFEEAITIDFVNSAPGPGARVAVEITLQSAKELSTALSRAIAAAEVVEGIRLR
jgi:hypothetical protein